MTLQTGLWLICLLYTVWIGIAAYIFREGEYLNFYGFVLLILPSVLIPWLIAMPFLFIQIIGVILAVWMSFRVKLHLNYEFPKVWHALDLFYLSLALFLLVSAGLRIATWVIGM